MVHRPRITVLDINTVVRLVPETGGPGADSTALGLSTLRRVSSLPVGASEHRKGTVCGRGYTRETGTRGVLFRGR